jgi:hypothetical protein
VDLWSVGVLLHFCIFNVVSSDRFAVNTQSPAIPMTFVFGDAAAAADDFVLTCFHSARYFYFIICYLLFSNSICPLPLKTPKDVRAICQVATSNSGHFPTASVQAFGWSS